MNKFHNPLLNDPTIQKYFESNLISTDIHDTFLLLGSNDQRVRIYRPDLRNITGSVISALLYSQLLYYLSNKAVKEKKSIFDIEIYKFKEPCNHIKYKELDSWCEELNITKKEFDCALKKIGVKISAKNKPCKHKEQTALVKFRTDINRVTWYSLNFNYFKSLLQNNHNQKKSNSRKARNGIYENDKRGFSINREDFTKKTYFSSSEEKGYNKRKIFAQQIALENKVQGSTLADSGLSCGKQVSSKPISFNKSLEGSKSKKIDNNNNSSCKKVIPTICTKRIEPIKTLPKLPNLKKIKIKPNPLTKFNFPKEVFEILNHWKTLGGNIPKDPTRRKVADEIANQIETLLMSGNNPYTPVLKDSELEQFRFKKWTVKEITDTITYFVKDLCKPIDMPFHQFIVHKNYKVNRTQKDFSRLVETFQLLPQELSFIAKKIKDDFTNSFPDVYFYDKSFINIATFLEQKLDQYKSYQPYGNLYFEQRFVNELFFAYMQRKVQAKGKNDELKYMANPQNLREFIQWCVKLNLIQKRTNKELREFKNELIEGYKNQVKAYQKAIDCGKAENWAMDTWEYFEFIKERLEVC